ncbi:restriction endonuclease subunit S [Agathobacter rectalis]|uniref:restriction endonuclease subunit S n=1 Tax=Agathobacter rectalis TaxID=39491 RepID=UPI0032192ADA
MENPKIRFKGFTKDWEQRKLGDVIDDMYNGQTPSRNKSEYWNGTIKWLSSGELNRGTVYDSIETITEEGQKAANLKIVPKGTFVMAITGLEAAGTRGNCALLGFDTTLNQSCMALFPKQEMLTSEFLFQWYRKVGEEYGINYTQGTKQQSYNAELIKILPISLPSVVEQREISSYLSHLDHLITLHQRKCEQTKKLKKYMLQKMFPQNGAKVPEIRFDGFTYDWEQRKLGDVFEQTSNLVNPKEDEIELWSLTVEDGLTKKSDRYNREFLVKKDDNFKEVRPGDIVYNPMNMTLGAVGYNGMAKSVAVSGYYTTMVAKENYDTYYINTWLKSPQAIRLYRTYATGSLIEKQRVQFPTLSIIPVTFPKYEEQIKIGSYFHSIDNLITLHQRKCDELKKMKKYMLQNMFI